MIRLLSQSVLIDCTGTVTMAFTGQSENVHILAGIFRMNNLYLVGIKPFCWSGTCWLPLGSSCQKQAKQCMLGYGWEIPPNMAVQ